MELATRGDGDWGGLWKAQGLVIETDLGGVVVIEATD